MEDPPGPSKMNCDEDLRDGYEEPRMVKMRDLESVMRSGGIRTTIMECSNLKDKSLGFYSNEEGTSEIIEDVGSIPLDRPVQLMSGNSVLERTGACLSLGLASSMQSSANLGSNIEPKENREISGNLQTKHDQEPSTHKMIPLALGLSLNDDPFYPYKKLGQPRPVDASECGSTTGAPEESDKLRLWKEMKQNGFLSTSHGGIPIPKQRGRQHKRKNDDEPKKKSHIAKREHHITKREHTIAKRENVNKYTKVAAPTGLLSGLNPGIIKHVRNSKQVNSIIEAMLKSEKHVDQRQTKSTDQFGRGSEPHNSAGNQFDIYLDRSCVPSSSEQSEDFSESDITKYNSYYDYSTAPQFSSGYDDDTLTLKLSSAATFGSEIASCASNDGISASQETMASLAVKAATVASHWLELLQQDLKGRLAALKRSKKRVRNAIQHELPSLLLKDISCNQENQTAAGHSYERGCPEKAILDMHMARWKSIFSQMDKALFEEGKHLECWLKQVQDMQIHCDKGLKYVHENGSTELEGVEAFSDAKKMEALENGHAVQAAAASIYSTCNFIMTKETAPCL